MEKINLKLKNNHAVPEFAERRRHPRFPVRKFAFAVIKSYEINPGQILNISMGGLMFSYLDNQNAVGRRFKLGILLPDYTRGLFLDDLDVMLISDFAVENPFSFSTITARCCGVAFIEPNPLQVFQLENFIAHHTSGEW